MIPISPALGFVLYVLVLLALLCVAGFIDFWRFQLGRWDVSEERLGECPECRYMFVVRRHETTVRCPRCYALCSAGRRTFP